MKGLLVPAFGSLAALLGGCGGGGGGGGTVVVVTNFDDDGPGSLRAAVAEAPPGATVRFEDGLTGTIFMTSGQILLDQDVEIDGPGPDVVAMNATDASRFFEVEAGVEAVIRGLRLVDGAEEFAGAILNAGDLHLDDVVLTSCEASRAGGVASGGALLMTRCTVRLCTGDNAGGVSCETGSARIESTTFERNSTTGNSGAGLLVGDGGSASVTNCTFEGNFTTGADRVGGAIAIFTESTPAELRISFCTISDNSATGSGGGIFVDSQGVLRIRNCIVAGNAAPDGPDVFAVTGADVQSLGNNVIGDGSDSGLSDQVGTPMAPIDPLLGPFADHGGPTETFSLLGGSPALDTVPEAACRDADGDALDEDQRGEPRPSGGACDAGAFES